MNLEEKFKKIQGSTQSFFKSIITEKKSKQEFKTRPRPSDVSVEDWDKSLKEIHKYVEAGEKVLRTESYYCTEVGRVKGMLSIKEGMIIFDPLKAKENEGFEDLSGFNCYIDQKDVTDVQMIKIPNESAIFIKDEKDRQCYIYDHYIQLAISTVDGKILDKTISKKIKGRPGRSMSMRCDDEGMINEQSDGSVSPVSNKSTQKEDIEEEKSTLQPTTPFKKSEPKALVFFRFSHRDQNNEAITNSQQEAIVDNLYQNILYLISNLPPHKSSSTKVPYYDSLIPPQNVLEKVTQFSQDHSTPIDPEITEESKSNSLSMTKKVLSASIPNFSPFTHATSSEISNIICETQAILISRLLPPIIRMREWNRLFSIDVDGDSFKTFLKAVYMHTATILVIQDSKGYKFGCYAAKDWEVNKHFYGTGESFLFTFGDTEQEIKTFKWSGENDNVQYCGEDSLALGGDRGKHALYVRNYFKQGSSRRCSTFQNEVLSSEENFEIVKFEVWGFECY